MELKDMYVNSRNLVNWAQNWVYSRALVNAVLNLRVP